MCPCHHHIFRVISLHCQIYLQIDLIFYLASWCDTELIIPIGLFQPFSLSLEEHFKKFTALSNQNIFVDFIPCFNLKFVPLSDRIKMLLELLLPNKLRENQFHYLTQ